MPRVDAANAVAHRPFLRWAAFGALVLVALVFVWWQLVPPARDAADGAGSRIEPRPLANPLAVLAVSTALAGLGAWLLVRAQRSSAHARQARTHLQALSDVLDVWQWQTDAQHRLFFTRPPFGAPAHDWAPAPQAQSLWDHFRAADAVTLRAQMTTGASLNDVEVWRRSADGSARPARLRGRAVSDASGGFSGYIGTLRDSVGQPASLETATAAADDAAVGVAAAGAAPASPAAASAQADAEAERESFSYTVSHDLRAPIRVVEGFTKIVKEDYAAALDRIGHDHLDRVLGAAARMNSMIDALLALSKLSSQPIARQPVNLSQLAGFIADDLRRTWPQRKVKFEVMSGMQVLGDPTLLRVVLENLLGNAWKYTSRQDDAQIRFERTAAEPLTFTIADNGAGFDMRFADRLFGVFQRLHSASEFPGTGVGLASVRRIVRRHRGEIWAESEPEHGARFHFTLPQDAARG